MDLSEPKLNRQVLNSIEIHKCSRVLQNTDVYPQWRTQEFCLEGVQQIQLRTEECCNLVQEISFHIVFFFF